MATSGSNRTALVGCAERRLTKTARACSAVFSAAARFRRLERARVLRELGRLERAGHMALGLERLAAADRGRERQRLAGLEPVPHAHRIAHARELARGVEQDDHER